MPPVDVSQWQPLRGGSGAIEIWPTKSSSTRPKLLAELDSFREQEIHRLGTEHGSGPSEARVDIARQCFDSFNRNFKTYEPLLSKIKRDYDQLIDLYSRQVAELGPLRTRVASLELELVDSHARITRAHERRVASLEKELKKAKEQMMHFKANDERQSQYNDEARRAVEQVAIDLSRVMMQMSLNARVEADAKAQAESHGAELLQSQDQVSALQGQVAKLLDEAQGMVPKSQYQKSEVARAVAEAERLEMEHTHRQTMDAHGALQEAYDTLSKEHSMIKSLYTSLVGSLELPNELGEGATTLTPRPAWEEMAPLTGNPRELGASTEQRVRSLGGTLGQVRAANRMDQLKHSTTPFIPGLGKGPEVPAYLQHEGVVRNHLWGWERTQTEIAELWRLKAEIEEREEGDDLGSIQEVVEESLTALHGATLQAEKAYNLFVSTYKYAGRSSDLDIFREVLEGSLELDALDQIDRMVKEVVKAAEDHRDASGRDSWIEEDFLNALHACCPAKSENSKWKLIFALKEDVHHIGHISDITARHLQGDLEEAQTVLEFTKLLRKQIWEEHQECLMNIQRHLQDLIWKPGKEVTPGEVSPDDLGESAIQTREIVKGAILQIDPEMPPLVLKNMMHVGFGKEEVVTLGALLRSWKATSILRQYTPVES